jgi:hypothetical protein
VVLRMRTCASCTSTRTGVWAWRRPRANGLFTVTVTVIDALVEENVTTLRNGGLDLAADQLFDLSLLKEVYIEDPSLLPA